MAQFLLKT